MRRLKLKKTPLIILFLSIFIIILCFVFYRYTHIEKLKKSGLKDMVTTISIFKNNDKTTEEYYIEREKLAEEQNKNTQWVGNFPLNKDYVKTSNSSAVATIEDTTLTIVANEGIKDYSANKNMQEYYSTKGYFMYLPEIKEKLPNVSQSFYFRNIINAKEGSICEYIIVSKYNTSYEVLIIKQESSNIEATEKDFLKLEDIWNKLFNCYANKHPQSYLEDFDNKNEYIQEAEIYSLCNDYYFLINNILCESKDMPVNIIDQTDRLSEGLELIDLNMENTYFTSFAQIENYIKKIWSPEVAYRLLYTNNGYSNIYQKLEDGGIQLIEQKENINPYFVEKDNALYRGAYLEADSYGVGNDYKIEIIDVNKEYCLFKKWYRNKTFGITTEENNEIEFLSNLAILKNYEGVWKFERVLNENINEIEEYKLKYETINENQDTTSLMDSGFSYSF